MWNKGTNTQQKDTRDKSFISWNGSCLFFTDFVLSDQINIQCFLRYLLDIWSTIKSLLNCPKKETKQANKIAMVFHSSAVWLHFKSPKLSFARKTRNLLHFLQSVLLRMNLPQRGTDADYSWLSSHSFSSQFSFYYWLSCLILY